MLPHHVPIELTAITSKAVKVPVYGEGGDGQIDAIEEVAGHIGTSW